MQQEIAPLNLEEQITEFGFTDDVIQQLIEQIIMDLENQQVSTAAKIAPTESCAADLKARQKKQRPPSHIVAYALYERLNSTNQRHLQRHSAIMRWYRTEILTPLRLKIEKQMTPDLDTCRI